MMNAAAPEGTPPRRIDNYHKKNVHAPPCLGEALRRGTLVNSMIFLRRIICNIRYDIPARNFPLIGAISEKTAEKR